LGVWPSVDLDWVVVVALIWVVKFAILLQKC